MMNDAGNNPRTAGQDDPWEQLAEELFGLEYGKEHAGNAPTPPQQASRDSAAVPTPQVVYEAEPVAESELQAERPVPEPLEVISEAVADFEESPPATIEQPRPVTAQDSYWDALANWTWDEGEGKSAAARAAGPVSREPEARSEPPSRREAPAPGDSPGRTEPAPRVERPRRSRERPERRDSRSSGQADRPAAASRDAAPSRRPPEPVAETGDFGSGLGDEVGWTAPEPDRRFTETPAAETDEVGDEEDLTLDIGDEGGGDEGPQEPDSPEGAETSEGDAPRRRRRRRRRRGRGRDSSREGAPAGETSAGETPAAEAAVPGGDWDEPASSARTHSLPPGQHAPAEQAPQERRDREGRPRRDRDRSSRSHGDDRRHAPAPPAPEDDFASEVSVSGGDIAPHAEDIDDDSGEPVVSYADVPSWEEAISYLLHPQQVQVEPGSGTSSPPRSADQPRQSRHYGRKHRH